jgi:hypothetical protein
VFILPPFGQRCNCFSRERIALLAYPSVVHTFCRPPHFALFLFDSGGQDFRLHFSKALYTFRTCFSLRLLRRARLQNSFTVKNTLLVPRAQLSINYHTLRMIKSMIPHTPKSTLRNVRLSTYASSCDLPASGILLQLHLLALC